VSTNTFESDVGKWLRAIPDAWVHHPVDHPKARYWKPADFLVCKDGKLVAIECKEVATGDRFPMSRWTPSQRQNARAITAGGGRYWLLVHFKQLKATIAVLSTWPWAENASLRPGDGRTMLREDVRHLVFF